MGDWTGGYVSDVEYVPGFYREQGPAVLDLTCLVCGTEPPRRIGATMPFTYCEIGCGHGTTIAALAAANPEAQFVGIDFMPAHIARAEAFRGQAGLENLRYVEADVVALADARATDLPQFDYVTLHGVYSWVSPEVRAGIVRFLDRFVKPGGAVYVSYNALPGWNQLEPAQRLLYEFAGGLQGSSTKRVREGIAFARRVLEAGSNAIHAEGFNSLFAETTTTRLPEERVTYLAHEFLNSHWRPRYHMDVARELAGAKLGYVGSANTIENFAGVGLSEPAKAIVDDLPDGPFRETLKDYFNNRAFRRDVYVRGRRILPPELREQRLRAVMLALVASPPPTGYETEVLGSKLTLNPGVYDPVFAALTEGIADVDDLITAARDAGGTPSATEILGILAGLGMALPLLRDVGTDAVAACRRHNRAATQAAFETTGRLRHALAVPVGHTGMATSMLEIGLLDGLLSGLPENPEVLSAHILRRARIDPSEIRRESDGPAGLKPERQTTTMPANPVGDPTAPLDDTSLPMGERVRLAVSNSLVETVPYWRKLGILDGADES